MATCRFCGASIPDNAGFCPYCGAQAPLNNASNNDFAEDFASKLKQLNDTPYTTDNYSQEDINKNKIFAIISYIGILFIVPILGAPESEFAKFHANQGLVLFIITFVYELVYSAVSTVLLSISYALSFAVIAMGVLNLAFVALTLIGIFNAMNGRAKELPVIGGIKIIR